ncbi:hypothetical protein niasHT_025819 [Heterodera trifolii]|uniref:Uncharacterized protein n=1 Tax=Heterodera trifolii TaxID=157864 RepID=A0ABD2KEY9_9BILA
MSSASSARFVPSLLFAPRHALRHRFALLVAALLLLFGLVTVCAGAPTDGQRWSNGVGLWGKRSDDLTNLALFSGLVDDARSMRKRPEHGWHKLNALWGKRSANSNWQTANGLWGKRSVVPPLQQMGEEDGE